MNSIKTINLGIAFLVELAMLGTYGYWVNSLSNSLIVRISIGTGLFLIIATIWGILAAPNSAQRLTQPWRASLELTLFGLAALALASAGQPAIALPFIAIALVSTALNLFWKQ